MKTINYRNGVVEFRVPWSWVEDYSVGDGAAYYEDKADSATLRVKVITLLSPTPTDANSTLALLNSMKPVQGRAQALSNGNALATFTEELVERGSKIKIFYWILSNAVPPKNLRIATFAYSALENYRLFEGEIELLDKEIRAAEFSNEIGLVS